MVPGYYGTPSPDSDVDILVVMETALRPVEQAVLIRQEMDFPFPVDLLVRTPKQIEERLRLGDFFVREQLSLLSRERGKFVIHYAIPYGLSYICSVFSINCSGCFQNCVNTSSTLRLVLFIFLTMSLTS